MDRHQRRNKQGEGETEDTVCSCTSPFPHLTAARTGRTREFIPPKQPVFGSEIGLQDCVTEYPVADEKAGRGARQWHALRALLRRPTVMTGLAVVTGLAILQGLHYPLKVTEQTEIRPALRREIRGMVNGIIVEIHKQEGDWLKQGDLIAVLDQREVRANLAMLSAERERALAELDKLKRGNRPQDIRRAKEIVGRHRAALKLAQAKRARAEALFARGVVSREALESAQLGAEALAHELSQAEAELQLMQAGFRVEEIRAQQAELDRLDAELAFVKAELIRGELRSPIDGVLTTPRFHESIGRAVHPGDMVAEVADFDRMRIEILVPERELDAVAPGQPIVLKAKSYPDLEFHGRVEFIPSLTTTEAPDLIRNVRVVAFVDNPGYRLKDKMTGWAEINCEMRSLLSLGLRRAVRWIRVRFVI